MGVRFRKTYGCRESPMYLGSDNEESTSTKRFTPTAAFLTSDCGRLSFITRGESAVGERGGIPMSLCIEIMRLLIALSTKPVNNSCTGPTLYAVHFGLPQLLTIKYHPGCGKPSMFRLERNFRGKLSRTTFRTFSPKWRKAGAISCSSLLEANH